MLIRTIGIALPTAFLLSACSSSSNNTTEVAGDSGVTPDAGDAAAGPDAGNEAATDASADALVAIDAGDATLVGLDASEADASGDALSGDTGASTDSAASDSGEAGASPANAVYTMSNATAGNNVFGFLRASNGSLTPMTVDFPTGGTGSGISLGEQGALAYDQGANRIYAVNAGDGTFSIFPVNLDGTLGAAVKIAAADTMLLGPKSVTFWGNTVYVLYEGNATTPSMIAGYTVSATSEAGSVSASPIPGTVLRLSSTTQSVDPAQVQFTPDGNWLVVTEKQSGANGSVTGPGSIDTFAVSSTGVATEKGFYTTASAGPDAGPQLTPYGFAFSEGYLVVSEAGSTGVASYAVIGGAISPAASGASGSQFLPTDGAPCWVATTADRAYVANAKGSDISGFTVSSTTGDLTDIGTATNAVVATTGQTSTTEAGTVVNGPNDESITSDGQFLYVLNSGVASIGIFQIQTSGTLTRVGATDYAPPAESALPVGATGLVVR